MRLKNRVISIILTVVMLMCISPVNTQAASNKLITLKDGEICSKYDITGNGKKDKIYFHHTRDNIKVYVNGKCCLNDNRMNKIQDTIYMCDLGKNGFYLFVLGGTDTCNAYVYRDGKFHFNYDFNKKLRYRTIPMKLIGNTLYVKTLRFGLSQEASFSHIDNTKLIPLIYRFKLENKKIRLVSEYAILGGQKVYTALQEFRTSSTYKTIDTKGPTIPKGAKISIIKCKRMNMSYPLKIQILYKGKKGWFTNSDEIQLY